MDHNIIADPRYGYLRLDPIPSQEEVDRLYREEFYAENARYFNNSALGIQLEQSAYFNARWQRLFEVYSSFYGDDVSDRSLFDIGFGFAQALIYLKSKGFSASGLESSFEGVEYARENDIAAYHTGIDKLRELDEQSHDLVLILNVLEHLREPANTLADIRENLLKADGMLVVEVPNDFNDFQVVANQEYNLDQWWVLAPNHINYFSHQSLQSLLQQCGYTVVHCEAAFPLEIFLLFGDQYVGNAELGRQCHEKRVNFEMLLRKHGKSNALNAFYKSLAELGLGRSSIVYAKPAELQKPG